MAFQERTFVSQGQHCGAWHYPARQSPVCVVMAPGLGGLRRAGLPPFAQRFEAAGYQVLLFDYRHFGDSQGMPRQLASIPRQLQDWEAAIQAARGLPGVKKIVLWGTSFSGGHVVTVAARSPGISGVIAQNPMLDGRAAFLQAARRVGPWLVLQTSLLALADLLLGRLGMGHLFLPVAAPPGKPGYLTAPDSLPGFLAMSQEPIPNRVCARLALTTSFYRPVLQASRIECPVLLQVCEKDSVAPPAAVSRTAVRLGPRAHLKRYPIGHFDIYQGAAFEQAVADQLEFLETLPG